MSWSSECVRRYSSKTPLKFNAVSFPLNLKPFLCLFQSLNSFHTLFLSLLSVFIQRMELRFSTFSCHNFEPWAVACVLWRENDVTSCHSLWLLHVTYKTGFVLDDWINWHLIHTTRDYRQFSAIADLHNLQFIVTKALGFLVFTSRILATDLSQSHCKLKWHMKSSLHRLIPFLVIILQLAIPKTRLNSIPLVPSSYPGRVASRKSTNSSQLNSSL
jgi:hypothetical protein